MVGLSHVALRLTLREYLPEGAVTIWPTEMLNSRRLPSEDLTKVPETLRAPIESELVPQILGNEELPIAKSVQRLQYEWGAEGIDINMGCSVEKALKHNYGVALMGDPAYAAEVVRMTVRHTSLPVSVKLRAGHQSSGHQGSGQQNSAQSSLVHTNSGHQNKIDTGQVDDHAGLIKFVQGLERAGISWVTLHPRTSEMKRRGSADWSQIRLLRENISIPVVGNGDVQTADDAERMLADTGCDMVMIGRALTARPWLLWQFGERLGFAPPPGRTGFAPRGPEEEGAEYGRFLKSLLSRMREYFSEDLALRKFRFLVRTGGPWLLFGHDLYARTTRAKNLNEMAEALEIFFSRPQPMAEYTDLRQ
jgi:tRNA-dihydrouridine synthase